MPIVPQELEHLLHTEIVYGIFLLQILQVVYKTWPCPRASE